MVAKNKPIYQKIENKNQLTIEKNITKCKKKTKKMK